MMHRFRFLGCYVAGIVVVVALTIAGDSLRRTADDHAARETPGKETAAPTRVNAESIQEGTSSERNVRRQRAISDPRFEI
jgi:hypothetical protein